MQSPYKLHNQPSYTFSVLVSPGNSSLASGLKFKVLLLRLQYTIPPNSTRRITANGANSTGQRLVERVGLVTGEGTGLWCVGLVVGEDTGLWCVGLVVSEDTGLVCVGLVVGEDTGLWCVELVVGEDTGLWCVGLVVGEDTGLVAEVIPMKADI